MESIITSVQIPNPTSDGGEKMRQGERKAIEKNKKKRMEMRIAGGGIGGLAIVGTLVAAALVANIWRNRSKRRPITRIEEDPPANPSSEHAKSSSMEDDDLSVPPNRTPPVQNHQREGFEMVDWPEPKCPIKETDNSQALIEAKESDTKSEEIHSEHSISDLTIDDNQCGNSKKVTFSSHGNVDQHTKGFQEEPSKENEGTVREDTDRGEEISTPRGINDNKEENAAGMEDSSAAVEPNTAANLAANEILFPWKAKPITQMKSSEETIGKEATHLGINYNNEEKADGAEDSSVAAEPKTGANLAADEMFFPLKTELITLIKSSGQTIGEETKHDAGIKEALEVEKDNSQALVEAEESDAVGGEINSQHSSSDLLLADNQCVNSTKGTFCCHGNVDQNMKDIHEEPSEENAGKIREDTDRGGEILTLLGTNGNKEEKADGMEDSSVAVEPNTGANLAADEILFPWKAEPITHKTSSGETIGEEATHLGIIDKNEDEADGAEDSSAAEEPKSGANLAADEMFLPLKTELITLIKNSGQTIGEEAKHDAEIKDAVEVVKHETGIVKRMGMVEGSRLVALVPSMVWVFFLLIVSHLISKSIVPSFSKVFNITQNN